MAQPITGSYPIPAFVVDGTTTDAYFHVKQNDSELSCIGGFTVSIPVGLTATVYITHNQTTANSSSTWISVGSSLAGAQDFSYKSGSCMGIRVQRTSGSGSVLGEATEFSGGGGGTTSSPSVVQGPAADNAAATGNPVLVGAEYNLSAQTYADGDVANLQADVNGNLKTREQYQPTFEDNTNGNAATIEKLLGGVSTYSPTLFTNFGANATLNVKATAGNVYAIHCQNTNAAIRYIQLHNTATTPAGGAVPLITFAIPASSSVTITHDLLVASGVYFSTGIAFAFSTTLGTYTAGTAAEQSTTILFK